MTRFLALFLALVTLAAPARAGSDLNGSTGFWELAASVLGDDQTGTVTCWVRPDTVSGTDAIFQVEDKGDQDRASLSLSGGIPQVAMLQSGGTATTANASKILAAGTWYFVAAVLTDTAAEFYVWADGSFVGGGSGTGRAHVGLDVTSIGCNFNGSSAAVNFFDGGIARLAVHSAQLTTEQVQEIAMGKDPRRVRPGTCVLYVRRMDGTVCHDLVGNRLFTKNGTIVATVDEPPHTGWPKPGHNGWTPASLTGLVAWLKGDAGWTTGTGPWVDQSGAGNDLDVVGAGAPATSGALYGGRTGVTFTADALYGEPAPATVAPIYGLLVAKTGATGTDDVFFWMGDKDLNTEAWRAYVSNASLYRWGADSVAGGADDALLVGPSVEDGVVRSVELDEASSTSRRISVNGGQQATNTGSNSPAGADRYSIGQRQDATPDGAMDDFTLYEFALATADPGNPNRILWFRYIENRWGVADGPWRY